jgi:hypothetical protein
MLIERDLIESQKKMGQKYKFKERMCSVRPMKWLEE